MVVVVLTFQRRILFPRHHLEPHPQVADQIDGLEKVFIDSDQGPVEGWLIPGHGTAATPGPAVIFAHGNGELIDYWPGEMAHYRERGITVLLAEYRGYGRSAGSPTQERITSDFVAFYDLLVSRPEVDADRIVFHGRSLGGGAVCALVTERRPAALILESTFTSVRAMARRMFVPGFLVLDPYDNEAVVRAYDGPLLVLHGTGDQLIPYSHGESLAEAAAGTSQLVPLGCGHNDCSRPSMIPYIDRFLDDALR